ncbi:MAG: hypothetical protein HQL97_14475, partial [Magnetococcales bacterium]|nr:hypothetical protein [Magnetococcales bacterium]
MGSKGNALGTFLLFLILYAFAFVFRALFTISDFSRFLRKIAQARGSHVPCVVAAFGQRHTANCTSAHPPPPAARFGKGHRVWFCKHRKTKPGDQGCAQAIFTKGVKIAFFEERAKGQNQNQNQNQRIEDKTSEALPPNLRRGPSA